VKFVTNFDALYPSRFLKAGLFEGKPKTLTIKTIGLDDIPDEQGILKETRILCFDETEMQLVINRTNGLLLKALFGNLLSKWLGKKVTLFPSTDRLGKEIVECIRVYGSPEIEKDMTVKIKLWKHGSKDFHLKKTELPLKKEENEKQ
jgi:hypothetical protein